MTRRRALATRRQLARKSQQPRPTIDSGEARRAYPRILFEGPAHLELQGDRRCALRTIDVALRELSPEGARVRVEPGDEPMRPRDCVSLRFEIGDRELSLPAKIEWMKPNGHGTDVGLCLLLDIAPSAVRIEYAQRIVGLFESTRQYGNNLVRETPAR